ncbi:MAG: MFS transporter [Coxiellaceae bacterium]|nr:MFS transporter [Coxiellaceae bacterium]
MFDQLDKTTASKRASSFFHGTFYPWFICLLAALFYLYDFIMRVTPSVMIHPLMQSYGVNALQIGFISAFYYYVYTPLQLPSGAAVDKYSRRWILTASSLVCALGGFIFAHTNSLVIACVARGMMGFGSAFAFVGALKLASMWLPRNRFALFSALTTALGTIGAVTTDTVLSHGVTSIGWRDTVDMTSWIGIGLAILIAIFVRDRPKWAPRVPSEYRSWKMILLRLFGLFKNYQMWLIGIVGSFMFLPVSVFASLWGVAFLKESFHLSGSDAALTTSLIFIGCTVGLPIFGWLSDKIHRRRLPLMLGAVMIMVLSGVVIYVPDIPRIPLFILLFFIGFFVAPQALVFALAKEVSPPRSTGISTAVTNFFVTMGAAVFQPLIGYFLDQDWHGQLAAHHVRIYSTSDFHHAFLVLMGVNVASIIMLFFVPETRGKMIHPLSKKFIEKIADNRSPRHVTPR